MESPDFSGSVPPFLIVPTLQGPFPCLKFGAEFAMHRAPRERKHGIPERPWQPTQQARGGSFPPSFASWNLPGDRTAPGRPSVPRGCCEHGMTRRLDGDPSAGPTSGPRPKAGR